MSQSTFQRINAVAAALLAGACASTDGPGADTVPPAPPSAVAARAGAEAETAESPGTADSPAPEVAAAIEQALAEGWRDLHIRTECKLDDASQSLEIFGNGVAILNRETQFVLTRDQLRQQLEAFREADFGNLATLYGGPRGRDAEVPPAAPPGARPTPGPASEPSAAGIQIACRVVLELDGVSKKAAQRRAGEQSPDLRRLAERIFEICREPARSGVGASDLGDGLVKVAAGRLAPETFEIRLHRKPGAGEDTEGWLLRLEGRRASTRRFRPGEGYDDPYFLELGRDEFAELLRLVAEQSPGELPINLFAEQYSDVKVRVLNRQKGILARRFAGMTPARHGERQERFDRILAELHELHRQVLARGRPLVEPGEAPE